MDPWLFYQVSSTKIFTFKIRVGVNKYILMHPRILKRLQKVSTRNTNILIFKNEALIAYLQQKRETFFKYKKFSLLTDFKTKKKFAFLFPRVAKNVLNFDFNRKCFNLFHAWLVKSIWKTALRVHHNMQNTRKK